MLADGVIESNTQPTYAEILRVINQMIKQSSTGDWLIVYFSGHGSQQPQPANLAPSAWHEPDKLDEIFLPLDVGKWDKNTQKVKNALIDDEIGETFKKATKKGISIWAIFDICHAGDMVKLSPLLKLSNKTENVSRMRGISPLALEIRLTYFQTI